MTSTETLHFRRIPRRKRGRICGPWLPDYKVFSKCSATICSSPGVEISTSERSRKSCTLGGRLSKYAAISRSSCSCGSGVTDKIGVAGSDAVRCCPLRPPWACRFGTECPVCLSAAAENHCRQWESAAAKQRCGSHGRRNQVCFLSKKSPPAVACPLREVIFIFRTVGFRDFFRYFLWNLCAAGPSHTPIYTAVFRRIWLCVGFSFLYSFP